MDECLYIHRIVIGLGSGHLSQQRGIASHKSFSNFSFWDWYAPQRLTESDIRETSLISLSGLLTPHQESTSYLDRLSINSIKWASCLSQKSETHCLKTWPIDKDSDSKEAWAFYEDHHVAQRWYVSFFSRVHLHCSAIWKKNEPQQTELYYFW